MGEAGREKVRREFASADVGGALAELFAAELAPARGAQPNATPVAARK